MNETRLLSVAEYAELKGITKQAVYKQLNKKLKPFVVEVDGKKFIDSKGFLEVEKPLVEQVEQPNNQPTTNQFNPLLEKQIEEKDKTIESLLRQVENLQSQNAKLTELLYNSQVLLAAEKKLQITQGEKEPIEETEPQDKPQEQPQTKKRFFSIFKQKGKKN